MVNIDNLAQLFILSGRNAHRFYFLRHLIIEFAIPICYPDKIINLSLFSASYYFPPYSYLSYDLLFKIIYAAMYHQTTTQQPYPQQQVHLEIISPQKG